jgi:hypothetical protein
MARGRKKDLTIPPTRTLVQQRDYRARRAQYITNLEERCRKAEEENVQLRRELAEAQERLVNPAVVMPQTVGSCLFVLIVSGELTHSHRPQPPQSCCITSPQQGMHSSNSIILFSLICKAMASHTPTQIKQCPRVIKFTRIPRLHPPPRRVLTLIQGVGRSFTSKTLTPRLPPLHQQCSRTLRLPAVTAVVA